jgi:hypothetical protein
MATVTALKQAAEFSSEADNYLPLAEAVAQVRPRLCNCTNAAVPSVHACCCSICHVVSYHVLLSVVLECAVLCLFTAECSRYCGCAAVSWLSTAERSRYCCWVAVLCSPLLNAVGTVAVLQYCDIHC